MDFFLLRPWALCIHSKAYRELYTIESLFVSCGCAANATVVACSSVALSLHDRCQAVLMTGVTWFGLESDFADLASLTSKKDLDFDITDLWLEHFDSERPDRFSNPQNKIFIINKKSTSLFLRQSIFFFTIFSRLTVDLLTLDNADNNETNLKEHSFSHERYFYGAMLPIVAFSNMIMFLTTTK